MNKFKYEKTEMSSTKKINVNYSSLVGLKAELLRKQNEVKDARVTAETIRTLPKPRIRTKKPKHDKPNIKDKELIDTDDIRAHKKSKLMLEAKTRLYDSLKKSRGNRNGNFLVDFENKSEESEEDPSDVDDYEDTNSDPDVDWVEYEDCLGRTRKCLRRDLPKMQEKDDILKRTVMKCPRDDDESDVAETQNYVLPEKEPEIEIMRRKWQEQTEKLAQKTNIHYQDVLFDEARAHGVGYYEFSQEDEERAKQQANLAALRKDTVQKQKEMQDLREQRDRMEQNRLKAARIRQRIRAGLPPQDPEEEEITDNKSEQEGSETNPSKESPETELSSKEEGDVEGKEDPTGRSNAQDSLAVIEDKIKAFGELLGKRSHWHEMSQEEWVHKRRKDRLGEFAPVYNNFKSSGYLKYKNEETGDDKPTGPSNDDRLGDTSDSEPDIGPLPPHGFDVKTFVGNDSGVTCSTNKIIHVGPEKTASVTSDIALESNVSLGGEDPDTIGPMPSHPPLAEINTTSLTDTPILPTTQHNLDEDKISAGLKFLRHNFERRDKS